ncbi:MAG: hypothetical protein OJF48_003116 [Afipia sp.]|jgi:hypothetical protein|nr:MAG: hypothetical protein OJF48_003116 [Afipia sp.]
MSDANNEQLQPPPSWEKFEEICADLFSRIWDDPQLVRYGRDGQRQNGVDIYGKENGASSGVQCKGKRTWPPTKLTVAEIGSEVEKAKEFRPALKTYIIATTAENDVHATDRANTISEEHEKQGLFRVVVFGWSELVRRLYDYPDLLTKHFSAITLRQIQREMPDAVGDRVVEKLQQSNLLVSIPGPEQAPRSQPGAFDDKLSDALERDFNSRYQRAFQRSFFPEAGHSQEFITLATELLEVTGPSLSADLRQTILFRAARSAAIQGSVEEARRFLGAGQSIRGSISDAPAQARIAVAEGRVSDAIQGLRDISESESRAVLFNIIAVERNDDEALKWLNDSGLSVSDFSPFGVLNICQLHLRRTDYEAATHTLEKATSVQFSQASYLYFLRGVLRFARLLPLPERGIALSGLPLEVLNARPVVSDAEAILALDEAINDLRQVLPLASTLGLRHAPRIIESYILWCELVHPTRREAALTQLRRDMSDNTSAVTRVQYAFAHLRDFNPSGLETYLEQRDSFGGLSDDELRAAISIRLHKNDAAGLASLIAAKRSQVEASFGKEGVLWLEVQALAKSGDATSASIVFEKNLDAFDERQRAVLRAEIAKAEGADPVTEHLKLYEAGKTPEALRALVAILVQKKDHIGIAKYAELLFAETKDSQDLVVAAQAASRAKDGDNFARLVDTHPFLLDHGIAFLVNYGWQLVRLGRLREAKAIVDRIEQKHPSERDLQLEVIIAIETGEWESLAGPLSAVLEPARNSSALTLIRAAHLAQASGQGHLMDLINAAVAKGPDDPGVLMGAYYLFVEEGLEEQRAEAHEWFRKALSHSGPDGPIQTIQLKELISKQTEWNKHTRNVTDNVVRGDLPLFVAAAGLRTTVVDLVLRNLIRNSSLIDGRRRSAIPLFSGRRLPTATGAMNLVALDITSLLVLGWLGILQKVVDSFTTIILPAGVLFELFEGRRRIRQTQRTRLQKANEVRDAIAKGHLKVLRTPSLARDPLSTEVGVELSALICEARAIGGIVIRSAPVHQIGQGEQADADMAPYADVLCDMHGLLKALSDLNVLDEETEKSAKQYFNLQDKGWAAPVIPDPNSSLFLDGLSLVYLQHTGLWRTFLETFHTIYIHVSIEEEANVLIEYDHSVNDIMRIIDDIRNVLRRANSAGRVVFGQKRNDAGDADQDAAESTVSLVSNLKGAEAAIIDDRALNKEPFIADASSHRARMLTTLDVLEELRAKNAITPDQYRSLRYRLRSAGAMLVPADADEIMAAAFRNRQNEAPEFRAIRDSFDLARLSEMPQFPSEMRWFMSYVQAIRAAVTRIWNSEPDNERCRMLASAIYNLSPPPEDWLGRWGDAPPPNWVIAVRSAIISGFAFPAELEKHERIAPYQKWFEENVMSELRTLSPETYQRVIAYLRDFLRAPWEDGDEAN